MDELLLLLETPSNMMIRVYKNREGDPSEMEEWNLPSEPELNKLLYTVLHHTVTARI